MPNQKKRRLERNIDHEACETIYSPPSHISLKADNVEKVEVSKEYHVCDQCRSRKIRCGRERPHCSNCLRLGLACEWLGQGKKPNQTIWLSHAVTNLDDRLKKIEIAVSSLQGSLDTRDTEPTSIWAQISSFDNRNTTVQRRQLFRNSSAQEQYHGSKSFVSLVQDMVVVIDSIGNMGEKTQEVAAGVSLARESLQGLAEPYMAYHRVSDGSNIASPPLAIVEAMMNPYFELVHHNMPLWTKEGFQNLISSPHNFSSGPEKLARDICANNLVLLTLQARSLHSSAVPDSPWTEASSTPSIDGDLIKSFVLNAKRALNEVETLVLNPSLLALQALLSLCLVAQTSFSEHVTGLLFSLLLHIANAIGLHEWDIFNPNKSSDSQEFDEKRNAIYCMLYLGRAVHWSSGWNFSIGKFTSHFEHRLTKSFDQKAMSHLTPHVTLSCLEEDIFLELYSHQGTQLGADDMYSVSLSWCRKLQQWATDHTDLLNSDYETTLQGCSLCELAIRYYSIQALAMWSLTGDEEISSSLLDLSRCVMSLFQRLWRATKDKGHYLNLARLVASYPAIAFFELAKHVLTSSYVPNSDIEILHGFVGMVLTFAEYSEDNSYMKRLSSFGETLLRLIDIYHDDRTSQKDVSPHTIMSSQSYMYTLNPYPGVVQNTSQLHKRGSGDSSSSCCNSNSTPLSAAATQRHPRSESELVPGSDPSTINVALGSFHGDFERELAPLNEMDSWMLEAEPSGLMREPNPIMNLIFQGFDEPEK